MTEATPTLPHITIWARQLAKREVKRQWQRQGLKPQYIEASELAKAAKAYLSEHRDELVTRAALRTFEQKSRP
jgi:hypothetical protein